MNVHRENTPADVLRCSELCETLRTEMAKAVIGQEELIEQVLIALLAAGHALVEGVAGLAKTRLLGVLAQATGLAFRRISCTPDLMPDDLIDVAGSQAGGPAQQDDAPAPSGPLFANLLLVEQIDLAPAKCRAALIDAIDQRQVLIRGRPCQLPAPLFVMATQNPLDREGTQPLRQSMLDRFLIHVRVGYPAEEDEWEIARRMSRGHPAHVARVFGGHQLARFQELVAGLAVPDPVLQFAATLVRASRPHSPAAPEFVDRWVAWGAGPRGLLATVTAAKARAALHGRTEPALEDVRAVAPMTLRHRIAANEVARADAMTPDSLVSLLMENVFHQNDGSLP